MACDYELFNSLPSGWVFNRVTERTGEKVVFYGAQVSEVSVSAELNMSIICQLTETLPESLKNYSNLFNPFDTIGVSATP